MIRDCRHREPNFNSCPNLSPSCFHPPHFDTALVSHHLCVHPICPSPSPPPSPLCLPTTLQQSSAVASHLSRASVPLSRPSAAPPATAANSTTTAAAAEASRCRSSSLSCCEPSRTPAVATDTSTTSRRGPRTPWGSTTYVNWLRGCSSAP